MSDLAIITTAELVEDLERTRIATSNRHFQMREHLGGVHPHLEALLEEIVALEHKADLELRRAVRGHPDAEWARGIPGLGERVFGRLVAVAGDPAERENAGKFLAYCGHGAPGLRRRGMTQADALAQGSPAAKKRTFLIAAQFRRTPDSPYRLVYDEARERYADRVHAQPCVRCGPRGHPAPVGSPWSKAHQDAAALRYVGKRFLIDWWVQARKRSGLSATPKRGKRGGRKAA